MKGEINRDWYCSAGYYVESTGRCMFNNNRYDCRVLKNQCGCKHRKWPTPEQFCEEYSVEWNGAVYVMKYTKDLRPYWGFYSKRGSEAYSDYEFVVCACTPWGRPLDDWRPE